MRLVQLAHERIRRDRLLGLVERQRPPGRRGGALGAAQARADGAGGADRGDVGLRRGRGRRHRGSSGRIRTSQPRPMASCELSRGSRRTARSTVRAMVKKRAPSGVSTIWVATRPGVWKAAWRFQRGQVPPKREKGKLSPAKRFEMLPGRVDPQHEEGDSARAGAGEGGEPVRDLLDAGAEHRRRAGRRRSDASRPRRGRAA